MIATLQQMLDALPLLSLLILTLPLGATLIWIMPDPTKARWITLLTALVDLTLALAILFKFDPATNGFQLLEQHSWMPSLNIQYLVGVDGISVMFLPLTVLLFVGVIAASWTQVHTMPRLYYSLLLILESSTLGIFCALDTILFILFWELTLIPLYFLISLWGVGPNRRYAAVNYTLFMLLGGVPLLFGFIVLAFNHAEFAGALAFDYRVLIDTPMPKGTETVVFLLLLLGFGMKTPVFPLHTWLPLVSMEGPIAVAAIMTGLKLGAYGLIRFAVPLAPEAAQTFHWLLAGLGTVGILYGALAAMAQTNIRRMLAYSSISHVGLVVLGIASFNLQGIQGALFQLLNFTVVTGGLFLLTGFLRHRTGSTDLIHLGGVAKQMPLLAIFFFLFAMASIGLPGTNGFPAEFLILLSALKTHTGAGLAALFAIVLGAGYLLTLYRKTFMGPIENPVVTGLLDLRPREMAIATAFAILILFAGVYPRSVLDMTLTASNDWVKRLHSQANTTLVTKADNTSSQINN